MQSAIFSPEDREFMDAVNFDLNLFIKGNNLKSVKAVLVFPPFNNFRRFLVHKVVEDTYSSSGLSTFSIGQDFQRRIIVCHSALKLKLTALQETTKIRSLTDKGSEANLRTEMIEKDVPKVRATANIYRPPAARTPASTSDPKPEQDSRLKENRRSRVRRPDQQVYVPRPKRTSCGDVEKSRSPQRNIDKTTNDRRRSDCLKERRSSSSSTSKINRVDSVDLTGDDSTLSMKYNKPTSNEEYEMATNELITVDKFNSGQGNRTNTTKSDERLMLESISTVENVCTLLDKENIDKTPLVLDDHEMSVCENTSTPGENISLPLAEDNREKMYKSSNFKTENDISFKNPLPEMDSISNVEDNLTKHRSCKSTASNVKGEHELSKSTCFSDKNNEVEDLTISDDSRSGSSSDEVISISSTVTESSSDDSLDSADSPPKGKPAKKCKHYAVSESDTKHESSSFRRKDDEKDLNAEERNLKNRRILHGKPASDVLIISDSVEPVKTQNSSKHDKLSDSKNTLEKPQQNIKKPKEGSKSSEKSGDKPAYNPDDYEWDSLFTDDGECLVPEFMEELTKSVGRVKITTAKSDYRPFQTEEERSGDGESIIEIYDFPAEFKTNDLLNIFASYRNRSFHIKWVDDTHALGVFGSPIVADEVLATNLPFVKTRPLRQAIAESRIKARGLALPPMERPKTCPALARRLVTGALGLRLPTASKEREAEKLVLKEAREKRRLDQKQREAVWEGTFN